MIISIIVTITFTRGNSAAVIKHGPGTSTPCSSRVYFREYEHHYIKFAAKCNTCAEARHATAMSSGGCYVQAERLPGAHGRLLRGGWSHTHSQSAEAARRTHNLILCLILLILSFLQYYNKLFRLPFLINLFLCSRLSSEFSNAFPSLSSLES